jgi:hypothetical protein
MLRASASRARCVPVSPSGATSSEASNDLAVGPQHRGGDRAGWAGRPCPLAPLGREDRCRGSRMMSRGVVSCLTQTGPRSTP